MQEIKKRIKEHEGYKSQVYTDTLGNFTIGYGHLVRPGEPFVPGFDYPQEQLEYLFELDFKNAVKIADQVCEENVLTIPEQAYGVLIEMAFQLGNKIKKFKNMIQALKEQDFLEAANQMLQSAWRKQTPNRCEALAELIRDCQ
jgi:lysozyme